MNNEWRVYFVRIGKNNKSPVKIGFTSNISQRLVDLQCGNHEEIHCLLALVCESEKQARDLESYFHWKLKHCHVRGEWFDINNVSIPKILDEFNNKKKSKYDTSIKKEKYNCPFKRIIQLEKQLVEYEDRIGLLECMLYDK